MTKSSHNMTPAEREAFLRAEGDREQFLTAAQNFDIQDPASVERYISAKMLIVQDAIMANIK